MCNKCENNINCICLCNKLPREINMQYLDSNNIPCSICSICKHNSSVDNFKIHLEELKTLNVSFIN